MENSYDFLRVYLGPKIFRLGFPSNIDNYPPLVILNTNFKSIFAYFSGFRKKEDSEAVRYFDQLFDTHLHLDCESISIQISLLLLHHSNIRSELLRENTLKSLISAKGDPRLNFSLENFLCAILPEMVSFDAVLHS